MRVKKRKETLVKQTWNGWSASAMDGGALGDTGEGLRGQEVTYRGGSSGSRRIKDGTEETETVARRLFTPPQATPVFISSGMCLGFLGISSLLPPALPGGTYPPIGIGVGSSAGRLRPTLSPTVHSGGSHLQRI